MTRLIDSTPQADGFRMPGEFEPHEQLWMLWPQRPDNWRLGGKPAQRAWVEVATAISRFEPVTVGVNHDQYENAVNLLPGLRARRSRSRATTPGCATADRPSSSTTQATSASSTGTSTPGAGCTTGSTSPGRRTNWCRRSSPSWRAWTATRRPSSWRAVRSTWTARARSSPPRSACSAPAAIRTSRREEIEQSLRDYLSVEKVIWLAKGIDPEETNGHVDDVACFARPGVVLAAVTEDVDDWRYELLQDNLRRLRAGH